MRGSRLGFGAGGLTPLTEVALPKVQVVLSCPIERALVAAVFTVRQRRCHESVVVVSDRAGEDIGGCEENLLGGALLSTLASCRRSRV